jgi:hypothetical protein
MVNKGQTTQWSTKDRQHNGQQRTDNTMVNKGQTTQWSTKDRQTNCPSIYGFCLHLWYLQTFRIVMTMMSLERFIVLCVIVGVVCGLNDLLYFALLFRWCVA